MPGRLTRVFFALWPPPVVAQAIAKHIAIRNIDGRRVAVDRLHLTLAFHGRCDGVALERLRRNADAVASPAFELVLDRIGHFRRPQITWLGPSRAPAALLALAAALAPAAAGENNEHAFRPHVSVVRESPRIRADSVAPIVWPVTGFSLIASGHDGAHGVYSELARWPLAKAAVPDARL